MSTLRYWNLPSGIALHLVRLTFVEGRLCTLLPQSTLCSGTPLSGSHSDSCLICSDAQSSQAPGDYFIEWTWCETAPLHSGILSTLWYEGSFSGSLLFEILMLFWIFLSAVIRFSFRCKFASMYFFRFSGPFLAQIISPWASNCRFHGVDHLHSVQNYSLPSIRPWKHHWCLVGRTVHPTFAVLSDSSNASFLLDDTQQWTISPLWQTSKWSTFWRDGVDATCYLFSSCTRLDAACVVVGFSSFVLGEDQLLQVWVGFLKIWEQWPLRGKSDDFPLVCNFFILIVVWSWLIGSKFCFWCRARIALDSDSIPPLFYPVFILSYLFCFLI